MKHKALIKLAGCLLFLFAASLWIPPLFPQTIGLQGLVSSWMIVNKTASATANASLGLRYLPEFSLHNPIGRGTSFDVDMSLNIFGRGVVHSVDNWEVSGKMKLYRMWLRISSERFEARLGLQKINFGSAMLLRPLMWFDRIDARDPLQITDGVYGLLFRYYFLSNANIWLWGLYGNDEAKGLESYPTASKTVEYGGRIQIPLPRGELALTFHHRRMALEKTDFISLPPDASHALEDRLALDGKWDIGIGIWFEAAMSHYSTEHLPSPFQRALCVGADYTFGLGNGLHVLAEHLILENSQKIWGRGEGIKFSALSLRYPLGVVDSLSAIIYYDGKNRDFYRFLNWQKNYDHWSFYFIGFWNPETFGLYQVPKERNFFGGKGFQLMAVFNH